MYKYYKYILYEHIKYSVELIKTYKKIKTFWFNCFLYNSRINYDLHLSFKQRADADRAGRFFHQIILNNYCKYKS